MKFLSPRLRFGAALLAMSLLPHMASAQFFTTDIPHIGVQLAEFAQKARDFVKQVQNFEVVKDAFEVANVANDISNGISAVTNQVRDLTNEGLSLQKSVQDGLKKVANIRNLRVSNMTDLRNLAMNTSSFNFSTALPMLGQTERFTQALANGADNDAKTVKDALNSISTRPGAIRTARDMRGQATTAAMAQLALENKSQEDKITQAFQYKHMADELTASAAEMQDATNTEAQLSMSDGERLATNRSAADMLLKAQELREKGSSLIASAAQKGPAQLAAEEVLLEKTQIAGFNAMHHAAHPTEDLDD